jgi:hypothetical protein
VENAQTPQVPNDASLPADYARLPTSAASTSRPWRWRLSAAVVLAMSLAILGLAVWLKPDARGVGTHEQLGLLPCSFLAVTDVPCPTCGMTTAFAYAAHGKILTALYVQPAGAMLAVLTAAAALVSGYALATGMRMGGLGRWLGRPKVIILVAAIILAGWVYKIIILRVGLP